MLSRADNFAVNNWDQAEHVNLDLGFSGSEPHEPYYCYATEFHFRVLIKNIFTHVNLCARLPFQIIFEYSVLAATVWMVTLLVEEMMVYLKS